MKTIGLLGGMSWESTLSYYRVLNEGVKQQLGGLHSARIVLYSVDFAEIEALQHQGRWSETVEILVTAAKSVEAAGADFLLLCTNTMHKVAPQLEAQLTIPLLHIADATARVLLQDGIRQVGLLGTRFTMEQDFYLERLQQAGIIVLVPEQEQRSVVHSIIYDELCRGVISDSSRKQYLNIIDNLAAKGAQAVILGCTEIGLLLQQRDTTMPLYDTTAIHARMAVEYALESVFNTENAGSVAQ